MPIPYLPKHATDKAARDSRSTTGSGVILYTWDSETGSLRGTFVLAVYNGQLAEETGKKVGGDPSVLAGTYDITTYTPEGAIFSTGHLVIASMGDLGAYDVTFLLDPTPENLAALGYTTGTRLIYKAIGYRSEGSSQLAVAWDNNLYSRTWGAEPAKQEEWGLRYMES